jgi:LysR family transcriptional regulator, glycine cleavage system transcriptional activator
MPESNSRKSAGGATGALPPFKAIHAFAMAAQHMSFKGAAEELRVTPSAISHAVSALEQRLGVKLFHRRVRQLLLTDAGRTYFDRLRPAFDEIAAATREISARHRADILTVASAPAFARAWLMPRLKPFLDAHPDIELRVRATSDPAELHADDVDAMVVYDRAVRPELVADRLMTEHMVPVCSPAVHKELRTPADLLHQTLIHTETKIVTWPMWLRANGLDTGDLDRGLRFNRADLALEAAKIGLGVALESRILAEPHIAGGSLVIPFESSVRLESEGSYFFAAIPSKATLPKVHAFRSWILQAARQD